jgi:prepilin-type N-terminal cleavage/methylation domain-containing protein
MELMKRMSKSKGFTLVEIMIVVAIIGIIIAIAVPGFLRARGTSRMRACQENLTKIDGAKEQWALETNASPGDTPAEADLAGGANSILKTFPACPSGFTYTINPLGTDPTCNSGLSGHSLAEIGDPNVIADESGGGGGSGS